MIRHRWRLRLALTLLLLLGGLGLVPGVPWPVVGWLRGVAFYDGMPSSWWRQQTEREDEFYSWTTPPPSVRADVREAITGPESNWVLGDLREHPASIPVLVEIRCSSPAGLVRQRAGKALPIVTADWADSPVTKTFVPALTCELDTADPEVRSSLLEPLRIIDPAAATRFLSPE